MDEITKYLIKNYSQFLKQEEQNALLYFLSGQKQKAHGNDTNIRENDFNQATKDLIAKGENVFSDHIKERFLKEHKNDIFLNYCPVCGKLARTLKARQCPCGHSW